MGYKKRVPIIIIILLLVISPMIMGFIVDLYSEKDEERFEINSRVVGIVSKYQLSIDDLLLSKDIIKRIDIDKSYKTSKGYGLKPFYSLHKKSRIYEFVNKVGQSTFSKAQGNEPWEAAEDATIIRLRLSKKLYGDGNITLTSGKHKGTWQLTLKRVEGVGEDVVFYYKNLELEDYIKEII